MDTKSRKSAIFRQYYLNNKDKIRQANKEYYESNREEWKRYGREYYQNNKDKVKARHENQKEDVTCECGRVVLNTSLQKHLQTKIHKTFMGVKEKSQDE